MDVVDPAEAATEIGMEDEDENIWRDSALTIIFVVVVVTTAAMIAVLL